MLILTNRMPSWLDLNLSQPGTVDLTGSAWTGSWPSGWLASWTSVLTLHHKLAGLILTDVAVISGPILFPLLSWRTGPWLVRSLLCWPPDSLSSYPLKSSPAPPTPWAVLNLELTTVDPGLCLCLCQGFLLWTLPADQPCSGLWSPNSTDAFIIPRLLRKPLWVFSVVVYVPFPRSRWAPNLHK